MNTIVSEEGEASETAKSIESRKSPIQIQVSVSVSHDTLNNPKESVEEIDPEEVYENCILFHVVCGDQVGEEFLVHADCSVGAMMDFIKRRLMEDRPLPTESRIELFDENGKSLKLHLADPQERGTQFVKQRGVYFPMYYIPENVDSEFDERELSQSSEDEKEYDAACAGDWGDERSLPSDEEFVEIHSNTKNVSSSGSSSSLGMDNEPLQSHHPDEASFTEMPDDGDTSNETSSSHFIQFFHPSDNVNHPYGQEYYGESHIDSFPPVTPVTPLELEDPVVEVSSPESSVADDDEIFDQLMREYLDEQVPEVHHVSESLPVEEPPPTNYTDLEFGGEEYDGTFQDILNSQDPQRVPSEKNKDDLSSLNKDNYISFSDSEDCLDTSNFSKSSSSDESENSDSQQLSPTPVAFDIKKKRSNTYRGSGSDPPPLNMPSKDSVVKLTLYPLGMNESHINLKSFKDHSMQQLSTEPTGANSSTKRYQDEFNNPGEKSQGGSRITFVPIIAETFDGCVKVCKWVVDVHGEIDRGVQDMEHMINEAVASQESQLGLRRTSIKKNKPMALDNKDKDSGSNKSSANKKANSEEGNGGNKEGLVNDEGTNESGGKESTEHQG